MKNTAYFIIAMLAISLGACNNSNTGGHTHDTVGAHGEEEDHEHAGGAESYTLFSGGLELFVEFPALVAGQTSSFAAHFTRLENYKPVKNGKLTVSIVKGNRGLRHSVDAPSSPGIFRPALQPKEAGKYKMIFHLESDKDDVRFEIPSVRVFADAGQAEEALQEEEETGMITYLKEQAWKTDFRTMEVLPQAFHSVIHTSGRVKNQPGAEVVLNAKAPGNVRLLAVTGASVKQGDLLAMVSGSGIENNTSLKLNERRLAFERSRADYLRMKPLAEKQLLSQKEFLETKTRYEQDSLQYYQIRDLVGRQGLKITAPMDGFVSNIHISNGEFVESGAPLITLGGKTRLLIETYVNQSDFKKVSGIFDANFKPGKNTTLRLVDLDGRISSQNAFLNEQMLRIPVVFTVVNNGDLMPGMFLEAFLKTDKKESSMVVPLTALIEEQGQYYVYVQKGGESFEKRQINPAGNDGINTEVESGLKAGERIVSRGAYQIKLAALAGDLPLHGHTH